jgi:hypothetical protein
MTTNVLPLLGLFSAVMCLACAAGAFADFRRTGSLVTPVILFFGMAIADVFLPAVIYAATRTMDLPIWVAPTVFDAATRSLITFAVAIALFYVAYRVVEAWGHAPRRSDIRHTTAKPSIPLALTLFAVAAGAYTFMLLRDIVIAGSIAGWAAKALTDRFAAERLLQGAHTLAVLRSLCIPVIFATTGALFMRRGERPVLFGLILPAIAAAIAMSTLLRGFLLTLVLGLAVVASNPSVTRTVANHSGNGAARSGRRTTLIVVVLAVVLFVVATFVRDYWTSWAGGWVAPSGGLLNRIRRFARGESWVGLMAIMSQFPHPHKFFDGKTIVDMVLLPIPRALWPSKPTWYGIDDITRSMGFPATTQSAVSMPGELFANFGYAGVVFMLIYGALFAVLHAYRDRTEFRLVYAFVVVPAVMPTFWMGFTGFVNQMLQIPTTLAISIALFAFGGATRRMARVGPLEYRG